MKRILLACGAALALFAIVPAPAQSIAPVPLMETVRGEQPIALQSLRISVQARGGLAETTVRMAFYNPNARALEGNLAFPLLDGQQVTGFALDFDGRMRPAVPVAKARGQQVFEAIERRGVDPALLEKTQGNNFRLRVYPIPAHGTRQVELRYTEALVDAGGQRRYRLPLDYAGRLQDFHLELASDSPGRPEARGAIGSVDFQRRDGLYRAEVSRTAFAPTGTLELMLPKPKQAQASVQALEGDLFFVAEVPVAEARRARTPPRRVGLLWDSSMSGESRAHAAEFALLDRYFRAMGDGEVQLQRLRDRSEPVRAFPIRGGDWSALRRELEATVYDGASALADWRPQAGVGEYLLFSDGLLNYGPLGFTELHDQRLYAINASSSADRERLRAVAEASGGALVELDAAQVDAAAQALLGEGMLVRSVETQGLADLERAPGGAHDGFLRYAGRLTTPQGLLTLRLADGSTSQVAISDRSPANPFAAQQWANYRLAALAARPELKRAEIARLGSRFGIATSETSLIVLDRVEDYVQHEITPPPELADAYAALREKFDTDKAKARREHLEKVAGDFAARIAWWEKDFPKGAIGLVVTSAIGGSIAGTTVPGATVVIEDRSSAFRSEATADDGGVFRFSQLPTGAAYQVTAAGQTREVFLDRVAGGRDDEAEAAADQDAEPMAVGALPPPPPPPPAPAPAAGAPPAEFASVAVMGGRISEAKTQGGSADTTTTIAIKGWQADAPYVARLRAAKPEEVYAIYLDERPGWRNSTGFYIDVADVLLERGQKELALRVLSNIAEMDLDNRHVLRVLGYRLMQAKEAALAVPVFEKVRTLADYEPQSWRDLGNAYAAAGRPQDAIDALAEVAARDWNDSRFAEIELVALAELNALAATSPAKLDLGRVDERLRRNLPLDLRVVLSWDADNSDMDLWVTDPNGEKCYYGHRDTYQGGHITDDFTGGYGPEEFSLRSAKKGRYRVEANYFGDSQQSVAGPTTLQLRFATKFGTAAAKEQTVMLRLKQGKETALVGEFVVD